MFMSLTSLFFVLGMVRKSAQFMSSISDERGEELMYGGVPIGDIMSQGLGIGGTIGLLWFRRKLPDYFCKFIELVLVVTADHGINFLMLFFVSSKTQLSIF
jgi:ATP citrate (pro-S)-lyase